MNRNALARLQRPNDTLRQLWVIGARRLRPLRERVPQIGAGADLHAELILQNHFSGFHLDKDAVGLSSAALSQRDLQIAAKGNALLLACKIRLAGRLEAREYEKAERHFFGRRLVARNVNGFLGVRTRQEGICLKIIDRCATKIVLDVMNRGEAWWTRNVLNLEQDLIAGWLAHKLFSLVLHHGRVNQSHSRAPYESAWR